MRSLAHSSWMSGARGPWLAVVVGALLALGWALGSAGLAPGPPAPEHRLAVREALPDGRASVAWLLPGDALGGARLHETRGVTRPPPLLPSCLRFHGVGFDTWATFAGAPSRLPAHPSWGAARGRGGVPAATFAVPRWSRARRAPSDTAIARRVRYPLASLSARSGLADQPPVVTRPLRGPPARG